MLSGYEFPTETQRSLFPNINRYGAPIPPEDQEVTHHVHRDFVEFGGPNYSIERALDVAGLNWEVEKREILVLPKMYQDSAPISALQKMDRARATVGIRPDGTEFPLGVVTDEYGVVSNLQAARMMEPLLESGKFQIARAGMTKRGRVWMALRNEHPTDATGKNDFVKNHMMGIWDHTGGKCLSYAFMGNRLACDNAIYGALYDFENRRYTSDRMDFRHSTNISHTMNTAKEMLESFDEMADVQLRMVRRLSCKDVNKRECEELLEKVFPYKITSNMDDAQVARHKANIDKKRAAVIHRHENAMGIDLAPRGTAWAWYSAFTEYVDHDACKGPNKDYMDFAMFDGMGQKIRTAALKAAVELVA